MTESMISISRNRQFLNGIPPCPPSVKVTRILPHTNHMQQEINNDPVDLLLTTNIKTQLKNLEEWSKHKEQQRCKILLEKVKQEEPRGKSKRGKEKVCVYPNEQNQRYEALKEKTQKNREDIKTKQQLKETEDAIQRFLAPDPVKRHKPKTPSNRSANISGTIEENYTDIAVNSFAIRKQGNKTTLAKTNVYSSEDVDMCKNDENITRKITKSDIISYMETESNHYDSVITKSIFLADRKSVVQGKSVRSVLDIC